jgi:hypothetical protein
MAVTQLEPIVKYVAMAKERFVYGLDKVPDDRLNWSPGGAAKSPLGLADKVSGFLFFISQMIGTGAMPDRNAPQPAASATREEAKARVEQAFDKLHSVLSGLTESDLSRTFPAPWGEQVSVLEMAAHLPSVGGYFQGQLNYAQLAYGDEDPNMPPSWHARRG